MINQKLILEHYYESLTFQPDTPGNGVPLFLGRGVIVVERPAQDLIAMFFSRRPRVIQLAETVSAARGAAVEIITEALGDPG